MSRKFAYPGTMVPGAHPKIGSGGYQEKDSRGRPLWNMPPPISYVEHNGRVRDKETGKMISETVLVPIYQAVSSKIANYERSQARRAFRIEEEKKAQENA